MWNVINNAWGWESSTITGGNGLEMWVIPNNESHVQVTYEVAVSMVWLHRQLNI